jgi:hypothetical protein
MAVDTSLASSHALTLSPTLLEREPGISTICVIAALRTRSSSEEQEFLCPFTNAFLAWNALKARHEKVGPIVQILLIQQALAVHYCRTDRLSVTSTQLSDVVKRIYAIGLPKEDDFLTIMMLNAMMDDLPHICNHIADALATSTSTSPYGPTNIRSRLDVEQQLLDSEKLKNSSEVAMVASGKGNRRDARPGKVCSECNMAGHSSCCKTCSSWGHVTKECFARGGAMEGKRDKVLVRKRAACNATAAKGGSFTKPSPKAAATGKPGGLHYDQGGCAYLLDGETGEAIYMATPSTTSSTTPVSQEFAGLAYDPLPSAHIKSLPGSDDEEYNALFAAIGDLHASIDWREHTQDVDFAGLTYKASNQRHHTIIDPSVVLFFLDSGASVHISNVESDFYSLHPILPHSISGIGSSSIQAIGVGSIHLIITKGIHLTIDNVLFIPTATVRLVSVSAICSAHRCIASFDESSCWIQACNGTHMLTGNLTSPCLYALSGSQLSANHVFLTQRQPTLESWHRRLGHAHYHAIYDLACSGNATGMLIDLSTQPPICDACVLGKQTKSSVSKVQVGEKASRKLGIIHVDLMEHPDTLSAAGNKYVMDIIDDFSSYAWSIPLASKSDAFPALLAWE